MNTQSRIAQEIPDYSEAILNTINEMGPIELSDDDIQNNAHEIFKRMLRDYHISTYISTYNQPLDKVITRYLGTLVPDTEVALGNGMPLKKVERWLKDSKKIMNLFIQRIHGDILIQEKRIKLRKSHMDRVKELKLEGMEERLGEDIMRHIYSFVPHSTKAYTYLCMKDEQIEDLMKMRAFDIRSFSESIYRHYVVCSRVRTEVNEIRIKFYEVAHRPGIGKKSDMIDDLYTFIRKCLEVKTKSSTVRNYFANHAYQLSRLMIYKGMLVKRKIIRENQRKFIDKELANIDRKLRKVLNAMQTTSLQTSSQTSSLQTTSLQTTSLQTTSQTPPTPPTPPTPSTPPTPLTPQHNLRLSPPPAPRRIPRISRTPNTPNTPNTPEPMMVLREIRTPQRVVYRRPTSR